MTAVSAAIGVDIADRNRDAPVDPRVLAAANDEGQRLFADVTRLTRRDVKGPNRLTYRDLIIGHIGIGIGIGAAVVGDPNEVADHIEFWFNERAVDGFNIFPPFVPESVEAFASLVVPVLQRRGLYRTDYSGSTFRDHLGLARPAPLLPNRSAI